MIEFRIQNSIQLIPNFCAHFPFSEGSLLPARIVPGLYRHTPPMADMLLFCACEDGQTDAPKSAPEDPANMPPPPGEDYGDAGKENAAGDVNRARGGAAPTVISSDAVAVVPGSEPANTPLEDLNTFVARLRDPGFFVTKYSHRAQLGGKKPRVLFTDETGKKLGWKAPAGSSKSRAEKENCLVEITEISEVRATVALSPDSSSDPATPPQHRARTTPQTTLHTRRARAASTGRGGTPCGPEGPELRSAFFRRRVTVCLPPAAGFAGARGERRGPEHRQRRRAARGHADAARAVRDQRRAACVLDHPRGPHSRPRGWWNLLGHFLLVTLAHLLVLSAVCEASCSGACRRTPLTAANHRRSSSECVPHAALAAAAARPRSAPRARPPASGRGELGWLSGRGCGEAHRAASPGLIRRATGA